MYSSFCNESASFKQSYPDFQGDKYQLNKKYTNAAESETLGYTWQGTQGVYAADSIYRFDFQVPHTDGKVSINFESIFNDVGGPEANENQWYGLDNISVSVIRHPVQLTEEEVEFNTILLRSEDPLKRNRARLELLRSDVAFVEWLEVKQAKKPALNLEQLTEELGLLKFAKREAATQKILEHGLDHRVKLEQIQLGSDDPEVRARLQFVFDEWDFGEEIQVRKIYGIEIKRLLKIINTPKAKRLLEGGV